MATLDYKGYHGTMEIDEDHMMCRGKVLFIGDVVTYMADTPAQLKKEFELAVDDYLETCKQVGKEPNKPCSGTFNVRVPADLHRKATIKAINDDTSLNDVVAKALKAYLKPATEEKQLMPYARMMLGSDIVKRTSQQFARQVDMIRSIAQSTALLAQQSEMLPEISSSLTSEFLEKIKEQSTLSAITYQSKLEH